MSDKKRSFAKKVLTIGAVAAVPATYVAIGNSIFNKMFIVDKSYQDKDLLESLPDEYTKEKYRESLVDCLEWFKASNVEKINIKSFEGLRLDGVKIVNHESSKHFIILVHGLNTDRYALLKQAREFDDMGFNLLMIDQRGFGNSEGKYVTYGFKESLDLLQWIEYLIANDNDIKVGLYGVSLGASTILKTLSYDLPENVIFAIVDGAYTSLADLIKLKTKSKVVATYVSNKFSSVLGIDVKEVDMVDAITKTKTPILFMHSDKDPIVPFDFAKELYAVCNGPKDFFITQDGNHGYNCFRDGYFEAIFKFITDIIKRRG